MRALGKVKRGTQVGAPEPLRGARKGGDQGLVVWGQEDLPGAGGAAEAHYRNVPRKLTRGH